MAVTILEVLQIANMNLDNVERPILSLPLSIAKDQLNNAVVLLGKGYGLEDDVELLLDQYGDVDSVPPKG